jgi:ABC-2 type transport system permease protein
MTAITASRARRGDGYGFGQAARMEWIKLRTLRSPRWTLAVVAVAMIVIGVAVGAHQPAHPTAAQLAGNDPTENGLAGLAFAQLAVGALGVLVMTGEYSSGLIRATLAAIPNRPLLLAAKTAVFGTAMLAAGEILAFATFFATRTAMPASAPHPGLGQPDVLRAVIMGGVYLGLIAVTGIGLGAIIRNTAGAVGALTGLLLAAPLALLAVPSSVGDPIEKFLPTIIAENSLTAVVHDSPSLPLWTGAGMLCLYAVVLLGLGGWLLSRRDA